MRYQRGFTLIELMVVLALAATLVTIGIPGFQQMVQDNRRASATNEMVALLQQARSEAIKRNALATICPSTNGSSCADGTVWETGWIAFIDDDLDGAAESSDGNRAVDAGEEIFMSNNGIVPMTARTTFTSLSYRPNGRMSTSDGDTEGEFILCDSRGVTQSRVILIFSSGRPQTATTDLDNADPTTCTPT